MKTSTNTNSAALIAGLTIALAAAQQAVAQSALNEFVPFRTFVEQTRRSNSQDVQRQESKVRNHEAFEEMRAHLLAMYEGVEVTHSFVRDASHFDCIPVDQQPAVRALGLTSLASMPPPLSAQRSRVPADSVDEFGNATNCEASTVPMRRITLNEISRFPTLGQFLQKKPSDAPATNAPSHKYAYVYQNVNNLGGNASLNLWSPYVNTALGEIFSLSQQWYVGGSGASTQTAEVGWQNFPSKYGTQNSVLFIYWTADNYSKTGCYNLDCAAFVQIDGAGTLGSSFAAYSTAGGDQQELTAEFYLYQGNWWLAVNGVWIGYYPGSIYKGGQMTKFAQSIKFGTESVGTTAWPGEGSGYWSTSGWSNAAYQRNLFFFDTAGTPQWASLTAVNPSPACYSATGPLTSESAGWELYFYVGGPGGTGC